MKAIKTGLAMMLILFSVAAFAWKAGDRILGQWSDGYWYPAKIASQAGATFKVMFDDGDVADLTADKIRKVDWKVGTAVECNWKNGGAYYPGKITVIKGEMIHISYNDGDQEDATISRCRTR
ncbi:MAG TPA: hypothetical protein PK307_02550 [Spirochaetota bacterium]|nr:hypothetical protein [Spirochaetota bacterium]HOD14471.1 hypothetical protein [Spirochaetota bacterium]HPG52483.1 hypothetical protein [Spirochaetota bacterium]HQL81057.1 hypothetical protein [Spirochaetota bacterium]